MLTLEMEPVICSIPLYILLAVPFYKSLPFSYGASFLFSSANIGRSVSMPNRIPFG